MSCNHKYDPASGEPTEEFRFYTAFMADVPRMSAPCPYCWQAYAKHLHKLAAQNALMGSEVKEQLALADKCYGSALDRIKKAKAREVKLREALQTYTDDCYNCGGIGSITQNDKLTGADLWTTCPVCGWANAALEADIE